MTIIRVQLTETGRNYNEEHILVPSSRPWGDSTATKSVGTRRASVMT